MLINAQKKVVKLGGRAGEGRPRKNSEKVWKKKRLVGVSRCGGQLAAVALVARRIPGLKVPY